MCVHVHTLPAGWGGGVNEKLIWTFHRDQNGCPADLSILALVTPGKKWDPQMDWGLRDGEGQRKDPKDLRSRAVGCKVFMS